MPDRSLEEMLNEAEYGSRGNENLSPSFDCKFVRELIAAVRAALSPARGEFVENWPELRMPASTNDWRKPYDGKGMYFATETDAFVSTVYAEIARLRKENNEWQGLLNVSKKVIGEKDSALATAKQEGRKECLEAVRGCGNTASIVYQFAIRDAEKAILALMEGK